METYMYVYIYIYIYECAYIYIYITVAVAELHWGAEIRIKVRPGPEVGCMSTLWCIFEVHEPQTLQHSLNGPGFRV